MQHGLNTDHMHAEANDFNNSQLLHAEITKAVIGAAFEVFNQLGHGFLEKFYQRAMQVGLISRKLSAEIEGHLPVLYKGATVGELLHGYPRRRRRAGGVESCRVLPARRRSPIAQRVKGIS